MELQLPTWLRYRQGKLEAAGENCYKVTAPVVGTSYLKVRNEGGLWVAAVAATPDGPDLRNTGPAFSNPIEAWDAAFELYRATVIY